MIEKAIYIHLFLSLIVTGCRAGVPVNEIGVVAEGLKVIPSEKGIYHSAFPDFGDGVTSDYRAKIQAYDALVKKNLAIVVLQNDFVDGFEFPSAQINEIIKLGKTPLIRILPRSVRTQGLGQDAVYSMSHFLDGSFDAGLKKWAGVAKNVPSPLMVEFGPEVNGNWYPWNGQWNGGKEAGLYGDPTLADGPERFRDAYRRVIDLFRAEGVKNVTWVFHVDSQPIPEEPWNAIKNYYPGDGYIDWIGVSVFGAQLTGDWWGPFTETLDARWGELTALSPTKPIAIAEWGVIEKKGDPLAKGQWISGAMEAIVSGRYPRLKAINYWHERSWDGGVDKNFRIDTSPFSLQSFIGEIGSPLFLSHTETKQF